MASPAARRGWGLALVGLLLGALAWWGLRPEAVAPQPAAAPPMNPPKGVPERVALPAAQPAPEAPVVPALTEDPVVNERLEPFRAKVREKHVLCELPELETLDPGAGYAHRTVTSRGTIGGRGNFVQAGINVPVLRDDPSTFRGEVAVTIDGFREAVLTWNLTDPNGRPDCTLTPLEPIPRRSRLTIVDERGAKLADVNGAACGSYGHEGELHLYELPSDCTGARLTRYHRATQQIEVMTLTIDELEQLPAEGTLVFVPDPPAEPAAEHDDDAMDDDDGPPPSAD